MNELLISKHEANSYHGNRKLVHNGRMYFKNRDLKDVNEGKISVICDQAVVSKCKGRAWFRANNGTFVRLVTAHGCEADPSHIATTAIRNEEKTWHQLRQWISGIQDTLPPVGNRKRAIQRVRFNGDEDARPPPIPNDLRSIVLPNSFCEYDVINGRNADQWLLGDSGYDENIGGRILIFGHESYLEWAHMIRTTFVDGTFKIAPPLFKQVFAVLAEKDGFVFSIATGLLPNKQIVTYRKFFEMLRAVLESLLPTAVSCDFEIGIQNAAKGVWPNISVNGCYWHLCANLYKHLQDKALSVRYDNDAMFSHECRKIVAMACVPIAHLNSAFWALQANLPPELAPILEWFERYYLGEQRPDFTRRTSMLLIDPWNLVERILNDEARTNNYAESHHRKVAGQLEVAHPTLWKFINSKLIQRGIDGVYAEMSHGRNPPVKRLKYRKADDRMKKQVVKAATNWQMVVPFEYLGSIAYNYRMAQGPYVEPNKVEAEPDDRLDMEFD